VNKSSLLKISLVCAATIVALGASVPQKVLASETGTVPIIKTSSTAALSTTKDNGTVPIVANPSQSDVTANPGDSPYDETFEVTISVNAPPSVATTLNLETDHPEAVGVPASVVVSPGSSTVTTTITVTHGNYSHHKNVKISVSANGTTVDAKVKVHYVGETD